jgi:hypothetical protein
MGGWGRKRRGAHSTLVVVVGFARYHLIYSSSTMIFLGTWITL